MKLIGVKEFYNITSAKIISAVNCCIVLTFCATATFAVDTALNSNTVQAMPVETSVPASAFESQIPDESETAETDMTEFSETTVEVIVTVVSMPESSVSESIETSLAATEATTSETTEATTTATTAETTEAATTTTAETTEAITEKELYLAVYAKTTINVRKGPGTEYDVVKNVFAGDQIDVIAVTSNGWYKTYNGNYVKASLTTETKPTNTPTPKPKPTSKPAPKQTTEASSTTKATEEKKQAPAGEGHTCTITFYGPQPRGDGTYSKSTASGTTCTEGRTCAADWSIYPAGTVIYIENDPLGGDGYYTVEDKGTAVKGYHIDIYAEDGESGRYSTCKRTVIAQ